MLALTENAETLAAPSRTKPPAPSGHLQQMRVLDLTVELLIARTSMGDYWGEGFGDARILLETASFPRADAHKANHRLQNAVSYCWQHEFGGAASELRALRGLLQRIP